MHAPSTAILPSWFRGALIALVTLLMCACNAPIDLPTPDADTKPIFRGQSPATAPTMVEEDAIEQVGCRSGACPGGPYHGNSMGGANCRSCVVPTGTPLGPRDEYLCDGGDCGLQAGLRNDWSITGLEQEDTIAHYHSPDGEIVITPSNRVCIYAPRFGATRRVVSPVESNQRDLINVLEEDASLAEADMPLPPVAATVEQPPVIKVGDNPPSLLLNRQQAGELEARVVIRELKNLIQPYSNLQIVKLGVMDNAEKPWLAKSIVSALTWAGDQAPQVILEEKAASVLISSESPGVVYASPKGKPSLRLLKLASSDNAKLGEEISFTLRVDNVGTEDAGNVTIVDNLATRLEYVPDSAESTCESDFKTSRNAGGSLLLRWEIKEPIEPGEGCVMTFRVKVL